MRGYIAAGLALALAGCGGETPAPEGSTSAAATTEATAPHYAELRKGTYFYITEVSENEKSNGQSAGSAIGFKFLGKNKDGDYVLANVNDDGTVNHKATCSDPCAVIHFSTGDHMAFSPDSVIGAAFTDAMNGLLEVAPAKHGTTPK